jgi:hypothetical protein
MIMLHSITLGLHNIMRWVVVIVGIVAVVRAFLGVYGRRPFAALDNRLSLAFTISMDVQLLLGLLLYAVLSPLTTGLFSDFGGAMADSRARFWLVEHISVMILAVVLAHIGRSRAKKAETDSAKHKQIAIFFTIALIAIFAATPWFRPLLPF